MGLNTAMCRNKKHTVSPIAQLWKARCERLADLLVSFCCAQKDCKSCPILSKCERLIYNPDCAFMKEKRKMDYGK